MNAEKYQIYARACNKYTELSTVKCKQDRPPNLISPSCFDRDALREQRQKVGKYDRCVSINCR